MDDSVNSFWNTADLIPPNISSKVILGEKPSLIGSSLLECVEKIISDLSCLEQVNVEGAIISRLVYRLKQKIHSDKGYKSLQKINHMLHNYLKLNLVTLLEDIKGCIFEKKGPSKEVLEWGLVNILRFSALFNRIYIICMDGAKFLKDRYKSGDFWIVSTICFAAVSRIWTLSQHLVKKSSLWYKELKAYLPYLKSSGKIWLPDSFSLPKTINLWLNKPSYLAIDSTSKREKSNMDDVEDEVLPDDTSINMCKSLIITEDLGESVSRETGQLVPKQITKQEEIRAKKLERLKLEKKVMKSRKFESLKSLNSKKEIIDFLCREGVMRQTNSDTLTKHLSVEDWNNMKTSVMRHIQHLDDYENNNAKKDKLNRANKCIRYYLFHSNKETM